MKPEQLKKEIVTYSRFILERSIDPIDGCRRIIYAYRSLEEKQSTDFLTIVAIESELDDVPYEDERELWEPSVFEAKKREKQEYLDNVWSELVTACESLISRFS